MPVNKTIITDIPSTPKFKVIPLSPKGQAPLRLNHSQSHNNCTPPELMSYKINIKIEIIKVTKEIINAYI